MLFRLLSEGQAGSAVSPRRAAPAEPPSRPVSVGQRCSGASLCPAPAGLAADERVSGLARSLLGLHGGYTSCCGAGCS